MPNIHRRHFLARTATLAAGATIMQNFAEADPLGLPIGIQLYTIGADMQKDAAAAVRKIAEIGYKEVETAGLGSAPSASALRRIFDENGLKCPSAHLTFDLNNLNAAFDQAHALGCSYVTSSVPRLIVANLPPGGATADVLKLLNTPMTNDDLKKVIEAMNKIGASAHRQGLAFASHNHTFEFQILDGKPALYTMIEKTDPASVKFEIDCGWITVAGFDPVEIAAKYPGRIRMLHVKDFLPFEKGAAIGAANAPKGSEIGHGVVDYRKIFAGMKGKGVEHIFVEQEGPFSRMPAMQSAEVDYKYLHALV
jgi:sugar phosphate isomerase/epimerase